jgi:fructose-1,6-bisphosphatase I
MPDVITIHRHIMEEQKEHPTASGDLSMLLNTMALACKIISRHVNKAGLLDVLGGTGKVNVQGEHVMKLDELANRTVKECFMHSGVVAGMASEEDADFVELPADSPKGRYVVVFDPLDGSSNIDVNVTIGTIFAIYQKVSPGLDPERKDFLQTGMNIIAAGYAVYGSSTTLVYTTGQRVHGFTLDPEYGEFLLSHPDIRMPDRCSYYSVNEANSSRWNEGTRKFLEHIKSRSEERYAKTSSRYLGTLVADFHRNLLQGGVFLYPADDKNPDGKLRLVYECIPLSFVAHAAGGAGSNGKQSILDIEPSHIHERSPLCLGPKHEVDLYGKYLREHA